MAENSSPYKSNNKVSLKVNSWEGRKFEQKPPTQIIAHPKAGTPGWESVEYRKKNDKK